jgi:hypothetical protein
MKLYHREWYLKDKEQILLQHKKYYEEHKEEMRAVQVKYRLEHMDDAKRYKKEWYQNHKEELKEKQLIYTKTHKELKKLYRESRKQETSDYNKEYSIKHKEEINKRRRIRQNKKRKTDICFRIHDNLRSGIRRVLQLNCKSEKTIELLGCDVGTLRNYLEKQFVRNMSWDNYGTGCNGKGMTEWHIDHIKPCASFDLSKPEEQHKCFHYTNLQPLWALKNLEKGSKRE